MISAWLATESAGALHTLRGILARVFQRDLLVIYDSPPGGAVAEHRTQLYDLFLPVHNARGIRKKHHLLRLQQRCILDSLLNGDLTSSTPVHYCAFTCCESLEATHHKFSTLACWALLPHKLPRMVRSRWGQQEPSICWSGVLASHHNLLSSIFREYLGHPQAPLTSCDGQVKQSLQDESWLALFNITDSNPVSFEPEDGVIVPFLAESGDKFDDPAGLVENVGDEDEWAKKKRQQKAKTLLWVNSKPRDRLIVMQHCLQPVSKIMYAFLDISGRQWERKQMSRSARGNARSYRVCIAWEGKHVQVFYQGTSACLRTHPKPIIQITQALRAMAFRMLSCSSCSMHQLIRHVRSGYPYKLFALFQASPQLIHSFDPGPKCLWDELAIEFFAHYDCPEKWGSHECQSVLQSMALAIELDIASIECKHGSTRRVTHIKSTQTWTASLDSVSAMFVSRQAALQQQSDKTTMKPRTKPKPGSQLKQEKRLGGGGGTYRAFLHVHHRGTKFTKESIAAAKDKFNKLSPDELLFFQDLGARGTFAHKSGFSSFGTEDRRRQQRLFRQQQFEESDTAVGPADPLSTISLLPIATRDLTTDLQIIRQHLRAQTKKDKALEEEDEKRIQELTETQSQHSAAIDSSVFSKSSIECVPGSLPDSLVVKWYPPCSDLAQADGFSGDLFGFG